MQTRKVRLTLNPGHKFWLFDLLLDVVKKSDVMEFQDYSTTPPTNVSRRDLVTLMADSIQSEMVEVVVGGSLWLTWKK